jgi:tripartite-type tricarboxylate transporter receptor subunit TctC
VGNSSEEFAAQIAEDLNDWAKLIKSAQIKLD